MQNYGIAALELSMVCVALAGSPCWAGAEADAELSFALNIKSLLASKCFACHGDEPDGIRGELNLKSRVGMLAGGETSDQILIPGDAERSLLYRAAAWQDEQYQMPPKQNDRLSPEQLNQLRQWIDGGAPWPDEQRIAALRRSNAKETGGVAVATSGGLSEDWTNRKYKAEDLWAYQPVVKPIINGVDASPIDQFVDRRLASIPLQPAGRADRVTLLRRATFDLLGLPPQTEEIERFVEDPADDDTAFAKVVDRLLASQRYGEQAARFWLDVVRYADTAGLANDFERPNAWRYRDYVIRSFNDDKPYDRFIEEQIAGDEIDPHNPEMLIAVGFLRMGPWEQTGMSVARVTRQQFLDDITDSVGQVFLAQPLQCCRCHDHKFDPIPTRDYYGIQAIFATTQFADRPAEFLNREQLGDTSEERFLQHRIHRYELTLAALRTKEELAARAWYAERGMKYAPRGELQKRGVPENQIAPRHIGLDTKDFGIERICRKNLTRHQWELDRYRPVAFSVYSGHTRFLPRVAERLEMPSDPCNGTLEATAILTGGDLFSPAEKVVPSALSCLPNANLIPGEVTGRRRALARWIADPQNPLTTRSYVNRIWQQHFGKGLAATPNNFGATGKKPTHPELLDWLAATFVEQGWSTKRMHRRIMLSDAYCRATGDSDLQSLRDKDPNGESYAARQPRRLTAEELRDSMLWVSGELNLEAGGPPIRPNMNLEVALQPRQIMGTYAPAYQPSPKAAQRNRRSIYAMRIRGLRDPLMEVFNQPGTEKSCELRDSSTVTPQVFALLNGEGTVDRSIAAAQRLVKETSMESEAITMLFQLAFSRGPTDAEQSACIEHWRAMTKRHNTMTLKPSTLPTSVTRTAIEEMNGEVFSYTEQLETNANYEPDTKPWDVDGLVRGLADVCAVVFNSNEFLYLP